MRPQIVDYPQGMPAVNSPTERENRVHALNAAALWLSGPGNIEQSPQDVVEAARVFERYLNN